MSILFIGRKDTYSNSVHGSRKLIENVIYRAPGKRRIIMNICSSDLVPLAGSNLLKIPWVDKIVP